MMFAARIRLVRMKRKPASSPSMARCGCKTKLARKSKAAIVTLCKKHTEKMREGK